MKTIYSVTHGGKWESADPLTMPPELQASVLNVGIASGTIERRFNGFNTVVDLAFVAMSGYVYSGLDLSLTWGNAFNILFGVVWSLFLGASLFSLHMMQREARRSVLTRSLLYKANSNDVILNKDVPVVMIEAPKKLKTKKS